MKRSLRRRIAIELSIAGLLARLALGVAIIIILAAPIAPVMAMYSLLRRFADPWRVLERYPRAASLIRRMVSE